MSKKSYRRLEQHVYIEERSGSFRFKVEVYRHQDSCTFSTVAESTKWARARRLEVLELRESGREQTLLVLGSAAPPNADRTILLWHPVRPQRPAAYQAL